MKRIAFLVFILTVDAQARVFKLKDSRFAGYLSATYGNSQIKDSFFESESTATDFSKGFKTNLGGDFGFLYQTGYLGWIFGFEVIKPPKISGASATNAGTTLYNYNSDIFVFVPKIGLEVVVFQYGNFRFAVNGAIGSATVTTENNYSNLTIAPNADFTVRGEGTAQMISGGVGAEWHMVDNATLVFQTQYRDLKFRKIKYSDAVPASFQGAQPDGGTLTRLDGPNRTLDFTGVYTTLGLRFWIR